MNSKKVIVRVFGGIGNQLFSYSAARRLAIVNNAELVIDNISGFSYDRVYKRSYQLDHFRVPCRKAEPWERLEPFSRIRRFILKKFYQVMPLEKRKYLYQNGIEFCPHLLDVKISDTVYLDGYYQSEIYFKDIEEIIRSDLIIDPPSDLENIQISNMIRNSIAVAIHYRFFDRFDDKHTKNARKDYYLRAIAKMNQLVPNARYFIFTDDPQAIESLIGFNKRKFTIIANNRGDKNAYIDLWLMTLCKHFIIANSTFSWWGAWLSQNENKIIIAPSMVQTGIGAWGFKGLIPRDWILI